MLMDKSDFGVFKSRQHSGTNAVLDLDGFYMQRCMELWLCACKMLPVHVKCCVIQPIFKIKLQLCM
jgi:hypothetical protein